MKHIAIILIILLSSMTGIAQDLRYVKITDEDQLKESWTDIAVPNMGFSFNEATLEQCIEVNGHRYASYYPYVVNEPNPVVYIDVKSGTKSIIVPPGTYGVHSEINYTYEELIKLK
jgi:hypothetical protein